MVMVIEVLSTLITRVSVPGFVRLTSFMLMVGASRWSG